MGFQTIAVEQRAAEVRATLINSLVRSRTDEDAHTHPG